MKVHHRRLRRSCFSASVVFPLLTAVAGAWKAEIAPETEILWQSATGNTYQLQWSPPPGDGPWSDLGGAVPGNNSDQKAHDKRNSERVYRVMETVPGLGEVLVPTNVLSDANPGFEAGSTGWQLAPIHSISTANPHSGASSLRSYIAASAVGGQLAKAVSSVVPGKSYTFSFQARQVSSGVSYVQQYRIVWVLSGGSQTYGGWVNFNGGNGVWSKVSAAPVTAPATAASARLEWYFATGAVAGALGEVFIDEVEFATQTTVPAIPAQTREISSAMRPAMRLAWPSTEGVPYQIEESASLSSPAWSVAATVTGWAGDTFHHMPVAGSQKFYRIARPLIAVAPPPNVRIVPTGIQNSISLVWEIGRAHV